MIYYSQIKKKQAHRGRKVKIMTFNSKEEVRNAWDSLKAEEKDCLNKAYEDAKEALREDGSEPRDIDALEALEEYAENIGWKSEGTSAYEDFKDIIEN